MADDDVASFMSIASVSDAVARSFLEVTGGDLEQAVTLFYDNPDMLQTLNQSQDQGTGAASSSSGPAARGASSGAHRGPYGVGDDDTGDDVTASTAATRAARRNPPRVVSGREDERGVIHIDSDDEDFPMGDDGEPDFGHYDEEGAAAEAATIARTAQEEEDAAMAKRLQEELYAESGTTADGVRAPIARTTETLVAPSYGMGGMGDDDDVEAMVMEQMRRRQQARAAAHAPHNPFSQIWEGEYEAQGSNGAEAAAQTARQARLAELYRPPIELISHLSWDDARAEGREQKKWILVNIQDMSDFSCQVLNRDIWKDEAVRQLVRENFIFLQYTKGDARATQYIQYYMAGGLEENPDNYPHVAIIDPRTGEQVKVWLGRPFPDAREFHAQLVEFLDRYSLAANSKNPVAKSRARVPVKDVGRMTEEEMLELALQNSLETANGGPAKPSLEDPDELTASVPDLGGAGKGKGKGRAEDTTMVDLTEGSPTPGPAEPAAEEEAAGSSSSSVFASIPSDRPHAEPANDPATTTRIQFRHASGRIIRRFATGDCVVRIYEWLKAEPPVEGKAGVPFELKVMPQGADLIERLDQTIEEAGLKQATVMIEYIED